MGIQALTLDRAWNMGARSTTRSRTTLNLLKGATVMGWGRRSTSAVQAWRGLPLMSMEQAPQTSSRQLLSHTTGLTFLPALFTGLIWISMRQAMTFMFSDQGMELSPQQG